MASALIHKLPACVFGSRPNATICTIEEGAEHSEKSIDVTLDYMNEGGANVIYSVTVNTLDDGVDAVAGGLQQLMTGKVLRIRKEQGALSDITKKNSGMTPATDDAAMSSTFKVYDYFHTRVEPLLPEEFLLQTTLLRVSTNLAHKMNTALQQADSSGTRPKGRAGSRLDAEDAFALLMENMLPIPGQSVTLELKPKWLSDSATTARGSRSRCRTCALRAMRDAKGKKEHHAGSRTEVCPLVWTQGDDESKGQSVEELLGQQGLPSDPLWAKYKDNVTAVLTKEFVGGSVATLFQHLAGITARLDPKGVVAVAAAGSEQEKEDLALAMTLRDCTLFVSFDWGWERLPRFKLADLDRKDWRTKLERWREVEDELVSGGWYARSAELEQPTQGEDREVCLIWQQTGVTDV